MRKPVSHTALNGSLVRKQPNDLFRCFVWLVEFFPYRPQLSVHEPRNSRFSQPPTVILGRHSSTAISRNETAVGRITVSLCASWERCCAFIPIVSVRGGVNEILK